MLGAMAPRPAIQFIQQLIVAIIIWIYFLLVTDDNWMCHTFYIDSHVVLIYMIGFLFRNV